MARKKKDFIEVVKGQIITSESKSSVQMPNFSIITKPAKGLPVVVVEPQPGVACPHCGKTESKINKTMNQPNGYMILDGGVHKGVIIRYHNCKSCEKNFVSKEPIKEN